MSNPSVQFELVTRAKYGERCVYIADSNIRSSAIDECRRWAASNGWRITSNGREDDMTCHIEEVKLYG